MSGYPAKKAKTDDMAEGKGNDAAMPTTSWVEYGADSDFPIQNLPYGVFANGGGAPRCGVAIGDQILDLAAAHAAGLFSGFDSSCFAEPRLNAFMGMGREAWTAARSQIAGILSGDSAPKPELLVAMADAEMSLPCEIGDYTDFYSSREHATNVGTMFRGADNALQPNWLHLPVGYHGRASSVVVSGTPVPRPRGPTQADRDDALKIRRRKSNLQMRRVKDYLERETKENEQHVTLARTRIEETQREVAGLEKALANETRRVAESRAQVEQLN